MLKELSTYSSLRIKQCFELGEIFGFETRNKYSIETDSGSTIGFVAEQQKGILGFLFRQFLGHWRRFNLVFFNANRQPAFSATHPFRWFFQRLELKTEPEGIFLGALQQRFSILHKRFDVEGPHGEILLTMNSPLWRIWTFPFLRSGREVARIEKKWSGILTEIFTDKDQFRVLYLAEDLTTEERALILVAGVFVDLQYFEVKARTKSDS